MPLKPKVPTVHGETYLPVTGGVSRSVVESPELRWPDFINYGRCETSAIGAMEGDKAITTVSASVNSARFTTQPTSEDPVVGVLSKSLRADRLSISIRSIHTLDGDASFELLGEPVTKGLRLEISHVGRRASETIRIKLEYYEGMRGSNKLADIDRQFREDREFFDHHIRRHQGDDRPAFGTSDIPRNQQGYVDSSIVKAIHRGDERIPGNVLTEPGLGTVYFGEVLANRFHRRVILIRLEMGSNPKGRVTVCGPESNGGLD